VETGALRCSTPVSSNPPSFDAEIMLNRLKEAAGQAGQKISKLKEEAGQVTCVKTTSSLERETISRLSPPPLVCFPL